MNESVKMIRSKDHKVLEVLILCSMLGLSPGDSSKPHIPEEHLSTSLYDSVTLPCTFTFIQSLEGVTVVWEREKNDRKLRVYRFINGHENLEEQNLQYRGRVNTSTEFPQGNLDLILRNVTYEDEGTYYCRAANQIAAGDKKVILSIDIFSPADGADTASEPAPSVCHISIRHRRFANNPGSVPDVSSLEADNPILTRVTIDGKRRWKCRGSGVYHNPQVQWITTAGEDLSSYGRLSITEKSNGRKLVESVLDNDVEANVEVISHIMEGRLKKSARGIISDNEEKKESPDPEIIICAVIGTIILIIIVIIIITTTIIPLLSKHNHSPPSYDISITSDILSKEDSEIRKDDTAAKMVIPLNNYFSVNQFQHM